MHCEPCWVPLPKLSRKSPFTPPNGRSRESCKSEEYCRDVEKSTRKALALILRRPIILSSASKIRKQDIPYEDTNSSNNAYCNSDRGPCLDAFLSLQVAESVVRPAISDYPTRKDKDHDHHCNMSSHIDENWELDEDIRCRNEKVDDYL